MRKFSLWIVLLAGCFFGCGNAPDCHKQDDAAIQVCFSPRGDCTKFIEDVIAKAERTILVQAYYFTSAPIADSLIRAHQKGIYVHILIDSSQLTYPHTQMHRMAKQGIPCLLYTSPSPRDA